VSLKTAVWDARRSPHVSGKSPVQQQIQDFAVVRTHSAHHASRAVRKGPRVGSELKRTKLNPSVNAIAFGDVNVKFRTFA
jgi:hypothetical protein